jgi:hypothetical protein
MGHLQYLNYLDMYSNQFGGTIPMLPIGRYMPIAPMYINFSKNKLTGTLPSTYPQMFYLDISDNSLSGNVPLNILVFTQIQLDLEGNNLFGELPVSSVCPKYILLSRNELSGSVPYYGCASVIDLTYNNYTDMNIISKLYFTTLPTIDIDLRFNKLPAGDYREHHKLTPQDIDECIKNLDMCTNHSYCSDGWYPKMNYTCLCFSGYEKVINSPTSDNVNNGPKVTKIVSLRKFTKTKFVIVPNIKVIAIPRMKY